MERRRARSCSCWRATNARRRCRRLSVSHLTPHSHSLRPSAPCRAEARPRPLQEFQEPRRELHSRPVYIQDQRGLVVAADPPPEPTGTISALLGPLGHRALMAALMALSISPGSGLHGMILPTDEVMLTETSSNQAHRSIRARSLVRTSSPDDFQPLPAWQHGFRQALAGALLTTISPPRTKSCSLRLRPESSIRSRSLTAAKATSAVLTRNHGTADEMHGDNG